MHSLQEMRINNKCNIINRGGRFELRIPEFVVQTLQLNEVNDVLSLYLFVSYHVTILTVLDSSATS